MTLLRSSLLQFLQLTVTRQRGFSTRHSYTNTPLLFSCITNMLYICNINMVNGKPTDMNARESNMSQTAAVSFVSSDQEIRDGDHRLSALKYSSNFQQFLPIIDSNRCVSCILLLDFCIHKFVNIQSFHYFCNRILS